MRIIIALLKSNQKEQSINQDQQKTVLDLPSQEGIQQFGRGFFYGYQVLEEQEEKQPKQVGIPCRVMQNKIDGKTDERPADEQAMVNERLFQTQFHHEAVLTRGLVVLHIAHVVDVEHGVG